MALIYSNLPKVIQEACRELNPSLHHTTQTSCSHFRITLCPAPFLAGYQSSVNKHLLWSPRWGCQSRLLLKCCLSGAPSQYSPCTWLPFRAVGPHHECFLSMEFLQNVAEFLLFKGQYNLKASYTGVAEDSFQRMWELQIYGKIKNVLNFNSFIWSHPAVTPELGYLPVENFSWISILSLFFSHSTVWLCSIFQVSFN